MKHPLELASVIPFPFTALQNMSVLDSRVPLRIMSVIIDFVSVQAVDFFCWDYVSLRLRGDGICHPRSVSVLVRPLQGDDII